MRYSIRHTTTYTYSDRVLLKPHLVRLHPRADGEQRVEDFALTVIPQPVGRSPLIDLDGNTFTKLWFTEPTSQLEITVTTTVETLLTNPFHYLLEPWAMELPWDYPKGLHHRLQVYLEPIQTQFDPEAIALAQDLFMDNDGNTLNFLNALNQQLYREWDYILRETGAPWLPGVTARRKQGSCRDWAVLFMEVCRSLGIPARFVSGYQAGDRHQDRRDLHGWVEVYLPGAGWRGYDPTQGLVVSEGHIPLCASAHPSNTMPIEGQVTPLQLPRQEPIQTTMASVIHLDWLST
ncbi:MAG: transglutaminase family protein [Spirulina sp. DLM2.Bin59]|nr:MAG: transglutaminase family protein [Spirulina sp. DLM2.Bin59]